MSDQFDPPDALLPDAGVLPFRRLRAALAGRARRWRLRRRAVAIAELVLCSSVPTQLAIGLLLRLAGWMPLDESGQLSLAYVVTLSMADFILLTALMVALTLAHGQSVAALWLGRRPLGREVLHGLVLLPVVFFLALVVMNLVQLVAPQLHNVTENPLERLANTPRNAALFALVAILAGGVREELQRAFLLRRFDTLGGSTVGVVVLSIAFGIGHVVQGWDAVIATGLMGAFWAIVYVRRGSAIAPIVSHAGFNSLEILRVLAVG